MRGIAVLSSVIGCGLMNFWQAIILGAVQGFTEFLPVSSSGHLTLGAKFLGLPSPGLTFSIWVHMGTAFATLVMLRSEATWLIKGLFAPESREDRRRSLAIFAYLAAASVPAGVIGLLFEDRIEMSFSSVTVASTGLIITGCILYLSTRAAKVAAGSPGQCSPTGQLPFETVTFSRSLVAGISQAIAIVPGISRSGMTISSGLVSGMSREDAARFSFLLSLPAVFGAGLLDVRSALVAHVPVVTAHGLIGAGISFLTGILALSFVFKTVRKGELSKFSYYCWAVGILSFVLSLLQG